MDNKGISGDNPSRSMAAIGGAIILVIATGILLHFLSDAFLPFVAALFLSNIFTPLVEILRKRNVPMAVSILLVLFLVAVALFAGVVLISSVANSAIEIVPKYETKWEMVLLPGIKNVLSDISPELKEKVTNFNLSTVINPGRLAGALSSVTSLLSSFALILLFMLFILAANGEFRAKLEFGFPSLPLGTIMHNIDSRVRRYLVNTLIVNIAAGTTMTIVLSLFGLDLALLWGVLTFFLMFIPSIGSIFAVILPILLAFVQFDTLTTPILLAATVVVTQLLIGSVISPKLMGSTLNLSALLILVSIIFWGWVWGIWGMVVAVPITCTLAIIFENIPSLRPLAILMCAKPAQLTTSKEKT
jgi:predicted PurR-regulated permease PerM